MDFLFNLGNFDIVLRLKWLETLGDIQANFKTLTPKSEMGVLVWGGGGEHKLFKEVPHCPN